MIPKRLISFVLALPLILLSTLGWAATYYVSPSGDDASAGTSASAPWGSIAKANSTVEPGDTVHLLGGRYVDDPIRPAKSGTADAPIRYVAYGDEPPVLTSDKVRGLEVAIDLSKRSHIVVEGVHIDGVEPGGPADQAGIQPGDIILSIDGEEITPMDTLATHLLRYEPGDTVELTVLRGDEQMTVQLTFGEAPQELFEQCTLQGRP